MENRTEGAWIIHHTKKLLEVIDTHDFEDIELAGKCGLFLSNLAASDEQSDINSSKVEAIAKVSNIKKTEIDTIKRKLADDHLIDIGKNDSISILGITTSSVLTHTSQIFKSTNSNNFQKAALELAENISNFPKAESELKEYFSDTYKLSSNSTNDLFSQCEEIGFVDCEKIDDGKKLYFNGNLFKNDAVIKTNKILSTLNFEEKSRIAKLDYELTKFGCVPLDRAIKLLGGILLSKLQSIGMYDFNDVSNLKETKTIVTKPSAFSKFGNPFEEDAFDLAKAFVSSLYYGINYRSSSSGKICYLKLLMTRLIKGQEVGPATAIGEDYKLLELKRVIQIRYEGGYKYYMRLLKKDIGELALQVLELGDATDQTMKSVAMNSSSVIDYVGPEKKRFIARKRQNETSKKSVADTLRTLRIM